MWTEIRNHMLEHNTCMYLLNDTQFAWFGKNTETVINQEVINLVNNWLKKTYSNKKVLPYCLFPKRGRGGGPRDDCICPFLFVLSRFFGGEGGGGGVRCIFPTIWIFNLNYSFPEGVQTPSLPSGSAHSKIIMLRLKHYSLPPNM